MADTTEVIVLDTVDARLPISRRDYFAALAPAEIPTWFNVDDKLPDEPREPKRPTAANEAVRADWKYLSEFVSSDPAGWTPDNMPNCTTDGQRASVVSYGREMHAWAEAHREWEAERLAWLQTCRRIEFFEWRRFYAEQMTGYVRAESQK